MYLLSDQMMFCDAMTSAVRDPLNAVEMVRLFLTGKYPGPFLFLGLILVMLVYNVYGKQKLLQVSYCNGKNDNDKQILCKTEKK